MTPQQIDRDLAKKVCGFVWKSDPGIGCWVEPLGRWRLKFSPSTSRDDCAEVLAKLTDEQRRGFLCEVLPGLERKRGTALIDWAEMWYLATLTPSQIAEAVWRAVCQ